MAPIHADILNAKKDQSTGLLNAFVTNTTVLACESQLHVPIQRLEHWMRISSHGEGCTAQTTIIYRFSVVRGQLGAIEDYEGRFGKLDYNY